MQQHEFKNIDKLENLQGSNLNTQIGNISNLTNLEKSNNLHSNEQLLEKLNYIIYILEDQRAQKSNYVTEEIILYIFLGIFIIFVLDKFNKPSKYTR